jgi:CBS domain-containing protein
MGVVYISSDSRLSRAVALKRRKAVAKREAPPQNRGAGCNVDRASGIVTLFDVVEDAGDLFLVMELRQRPVMGPRSKAAAASAGCEASWCAIAEALAAAPMSGASCIATSNRTT